MLDDYHALNSSWEVIIKVHSSDFGQSKMAAYLLQKKYSRVFFILILENDEQRMRTDVDSTVFSYQITFSY